jgi:hypothetical protein
MCTIGVDVAAGMAAGEAQQPDKGDHCHNGVLHALVSFARPVSALARPLGAGTLSFLQGVLRSGTMAQANGVPVRRIESYPGGSGV